MHISFWFKPRICDSKPNERKSPKPCIFRTNFSSVWLLSKHNSKAADMRINYSHKRKKNLLWGFISWRGFLSKRKKEKKVAFNKFTWSRYISYIIWSISIKEHFVYFCRQYMDYVVSIFPFCSISLFSYFAIFFRMIASFLSFSSGLLELHLLDFDPHDESCELAACPFLYIQPEEGSGKGCYFPTYGRKMNQWINI